jgi:hypothetical protein
MLTAEPEECWRVGEIWKQESQAVNAPLLSYRLAQTCASIAKFAAAEATER